MRMIVSAVLTVAALSGCEHKQGDAPKPGEAAKGSAAATTAGSKAAPTDDVVRAPTKADVAAYTQDIAGSGDLLAAIETPQGTFHCKLLADKAPMTVANFVGLATGKKPWLDPRTGETRRGVPYYDGLIFHRVIPGFMIQGGDPLGKGVGGPGYGFDDEIDASEKLTPGTLAMANTGQPGSNGSQFFITSGSPSYLDGKHTVFGRCKEVELVSTIENVPKSNGDTPASPVTMKVTISKGTF